VIQQAYNFLTTKNDPQAETFVYLPNFILETGVPESDVFIQGVRPLFFRKCYAEFLKLILAPFFQNRHELMDQLYWHRQQVNRCCAPAIERSLLEGMVYRLFCASDADTGNSSITVHKLPATTTFGLSASVINSFQRK